MDRLWNYQEKVATVVERWSFSGGSTVHFGML